MKRVQTIALAAMATALPVAVFADSAESKAFVMEALNAALIAGNPDVVPQYWSPDYIQHNPDVGNGMEAQKGLIQYMNSTGAFEAEYVRVIADDDIVAVHARYLGFGPQATIGFDVFRVENGLIVEHWDNLTQEQPPNPSGRGQIDGATEITDLDQTEANKAIVEEFITLALIENAEVNFADYINPAQYFQHNAFVGDGLDGFGAAMADMAQNGSAMTMCSVL